MICEECGGDGVVYWYDAPDYEEEEEECDVCKGSGTLKDAEMMNNKKLYRYQ